MKKTQFIELLRNIGGTKVSYFSIAVFVMLGVALFSGLSWGSASILENAENAIMEKGHFQDIELIFPYGIDEEGINALLDMESVDEAEGAQVTYGFFRLDSGSYQAVIHSLPGEIDRILSYEGTLPEKEDEIAVYASWAKDMGLKIGDTVTFFQTEAGIADLKTDSFTVTALLTVSDYLTGIFGTSAVSGIYLNTFFYVSDEAWDTGANASFTRVKLRSDALREDSLFSDAYQEKLTAWKEEVLEKAEELSHRRFTSISPYLPAGTEEAEPAAVLSVDNATIKNYRTMKSSINKVRYVLSLLFVLVGLLVCYCAVSRLVYEQIVRIGTKKALGLSTREITRGYLCYSLSSAIFGCILGIGLSILVCYVFLWVLLGADFPFAFMIIPDIPVTAVVSVIEVLAVALTTLVACRSILKLNAVTLLAGPEPPSGKKHFFDNFGIWKRASLITKTIVSNFLTDRRRVLGTLVGISSCTMLLIMALTLYMNCTKSREIHENEHYLFDTSVYFAAGKEGAAAEIEDKLEELGLRFLPAYVTLLSMDTPAGDAMMAIVTVPEDSEKFREFSVMEAVNESALTPYDGAWLSIGYQSTNGGSYTQTVTGLSTEGERITAALDGFFYSYSFMGELVLTRERYEELYDRDWSANCLLVDTEGLSRAELDQKLREIDGYLLSMKFLEQNDAAYEMLYTLMIAVVGISLVLSVVMAFLVILNLLAMMVAEKKKQVIVLRINGYTLKEARKYLSADTVLLTVISILLAVPLGTYTGILTIRSIESSSVYLLKDLNLPACLAGALVTVILVCIASGVTMKTVNTFKLTDINQ